MAVHVCSLKFDAERDGRQSVPHGDDYYLVRFPFGSDESYDPENMHPADGDARLVHPGAEAWGRLYAMVQWAEAPDAGSNEFRDQFARDPLDAIDTTCTEHHAGTTGMQCFAKSWAMFVKPGVPLGLRVAHGAPDALDLVLAEFKLEYLT